MAWGSRAHPTKRGADGAPPPAPRGPRAPARARTGSCTYAHTEMQTLTHDVDESTIQSGQTDEQNNTQPTGTLPVDDRRRLVELACGSAVLAPEEHDSPCMHAGLPRRAIRLSVP